MIQLQSRIKVVDNSGAKEIMVIQVRGRKKGGHYQRFGTVGELISASVKKAAPNSAIEKGEVVHAIIVRTKKEIKRKDGSHIKFDDNAAVIIDPETGAMKGSRIFGPVARELREKGFNKIVSLATEVV